MKRWDRRPFEVKNLLNPAFCGLVLFRALEGYETRNKEGMPFSLALLVLPLCLHKDTREVFTGKSRRYLLKIIEENPQLLVGFADRVHHLTPFTLEALGLLMERECFTVSPEGRLKTVPKRVRKKVTGTDEFQACLRAASIVGKEFARIADRVTIYTTFGIRP